MSQWSSRIKGVYDGHVHMRSLDGQDAMMAILRSTGIEKMALASIQDPAAGTGLPRSLLMKYRHSDTFFVLAGLNHAARLSGGTVRTPALADQVDAFITMGCDGIKLIESKPTSRQKMNVPVTNPYYADFWACAEKRGVHVLWHVADPGEFWDPEKTPAWAKKRNWGYGPADVQKETLYTEVEEVLRRRPRLKITFAHLYFLSADLPRAARFLDAHPNVRVDLAPGIEMLYNISRSPEAGREFFIRYADRIVFGTDLMSEQTAEEGKYRAGMVFRWLETEDEFRRPNGADFLIGPPEDGIIRGMALPDDVLRKIYRDNIIGLIGAKPKKLDVGLSIGECRRLAEIAQIMSGKPAAETEAGKVADALEGAA